MVQIYFNSFTFESGLELLQVEYLSLPRMTEPLKEKLGADS